MRKRLLLWLLLIAMLLSVGCSKSAAEPQFDSYTLPVQPTSNVSTPNGGEEASAAQDTETPLPESKPEKTQAPLNSKEFWEQEEDLYRVYDITQESVSTYAVITEVQYHEAQDRFAITINPVIEDYEPREAIRDDGLHYTAYDLKPKIEQTTMRFLLDPNGAYTYADPSDPDFLSSRTVPIEQFVTVATQNVQDKPLFFKIETIQGTVISARLWDMFYLNEAYQARVAAEIAATPNPVMTPWPTIPS